MRVALVCPYDLGKPGGVQDQVVGLRSWLEAAGHETVVVGPGTEGPPDAVLLGGTVTLPANRSAVPIAVDPRVVARVRAATDGADVVHIHEPLMPVVSLTATRISHQPTVGTFHADAPTWARRILSMGAPLTRIVTTHLDVVSAVSEVARSSVSALDPVRIIPNGIDVGAFEASEKEPESVVFVGRDDPRKGLSILLAAWPRVRADHPGAVLRVVGTIRDDAPDGVEFLGRLDGGEKAAVLARSAVAVAPNTGGESFGIVIAEAMASGCAVVASTLPAFIAVAGDTAELVGVGDVEEFGRRISMLLDDPLRTATLGAAARERVRRFDLDVVGAAYVDAYEDAIRLHR